ncbi:MAG TPA: gfo/Idh/MocA family oxidoreductase, partial [Armatimonadota bacterium]|nr:gfo/Idh/MocA family oxidoreductase [Armatimonadota bacterium]
LVLEGGKLTFWRTRSSVQKYIYEAQGGFQKPETWQIEIPAGGGEGHKGITKNWIQAITSGAPLLARGEEGINGVQLANAMLLSTWTDDWVEIPVDEELFLARLKEKIETSTVQKSSGSALNFDGTFGSGA